MTGGKIGLIIGSILAFIILVMGFRWFSSLPVEIEHKVWVPTDCRVEKASDAHLSGIVLFKPFSEYQKRFSDAKTLLILVNERLLYYLAKGEDGVTYATVIRPIDTQPMGRILIDTQIIGSVLKARYTRNWAWGFMLFGLMPFLLIVASFGVGGIISDTRKKMRENTEGLAATGKS